MGLPSAARPDPDGTPLLVLRPPSPGDAGWITEACQDPAIQRWTRVPVPYQRTDAEAFVRDWAGSEAVWAVVDAVTGEGHAMVAIHAVTDGDAALGYWVAPWARKRGVATWATCRVVDNLASHTSVVSASLDVAISNPASAGVARKAGFSAGPTPAGLVVPDGDGTTVAVRYHRAVRTTGPPPMRTATVYDS
jgi:RimJ/RimL family protein N-acetyltransferase